MNRHINTFEKGMVQDADVLLQPPGTYRYAYNGRIRFNEKGSFSFGNNKGNKLVFSLPEGYEPVGDCDMEDFLVVFSTDGNHSEIGIATIDALQNGLYRTIFNDGFDPNGDKLHFSTEHYILVAEPVIESVNIKRVKWTDKFKEPRTFNVQLAFKETNTTDYVNAAVWHSTSPYPFWFSVHSMSDRTDVSWGRLKFRRQIQNGGKVKTGLYQLCYRYLTKDNHATVWSPLSRHYFVTAADSSANQHEYQMSGSNIVTNKSLEFELAGIDKRYPRLEAAFVYSIGAKATVEAVIFRKIELNGAGGNILLELKAHSGDPVLLSDIPKRYEWFVTVGTMKEQESHFFYGNVKTGGGKLWAEVSGATIQPKYRLMESDGLTEPTVPPLTNSSPQTLTVSKQSFIRNDNQPETESFEIINDYANYKGMQWEHLFTSYWRGEVYPFALVVFDKKGQPFYAQPIADYQTPQLYEGGGTNTLTQQENGKWKLRLLGLEFSGIDLSGILFDEDGKLQISGFSIVRTERIKRVLCQGVLLPTVYNHTEDRNITRPLPFFVNSFDSGVQSDGLTPFSHFYNDGIHSSTGDHAFFSRAYTFTYHSPEVVFGLDLAVQPADAMKLVGTCHKGYSKQGVEQTGENDHFYSKSYKTDNAVNHYPLGAESRVVYVNENGFGSQREGYNPNNSALKFVNSAEIKLNNAGGNGICGADVTTGTAIKSWGCRGTLLTVLKDWHSMDITGGDGCSLASYHIVNYLRPVSSYYTDPQNFETRKYYSTGHFQPVNEEVLAKVKKTVNGKDTYIFNGVEVWGGDCYPDFFDFLRLYPQYSGDCKTRQGVYQDYANGLIVPLESNYNTALGWGRRYAAAGSMPERTACEGSDPELIKGVMSEQPEDFNVNDVVLHQENLVFYFPKPREITDEVSFPNRWYFSEKKIYNELDDRYRRILNNNFSDIDGVCGEIVQSVVLFNRLYSISESGYGILRVNERGLVPGSNFSKIVVGSGEVLAGIQWRSKEYGTQHPHSVVRLNNGFYFIDSRKGKLLRESQRGKDQLSDSEGQHDFMEANLPFYEKDMNTAQKSSLITAAADYLNNEVLWTLYSSEVSPVTLVYNQELEAFTGEQPFTPKRYLQFRKFFLSADPAHANKIYLHQYGQRGRFYNTLHQTVIRVIVNPDAPVEKVFDSMLLNINKTGAVLANKVTATTQNGTQTIFLKTDARAEYKEDLLRFPLMELNKDQRVRGKAMEVEIAFENANDAPLLLTSVLTIFRVSRRV